MNAALRFARPRRRGDRTPQPPSSSRPSCPVPQPASKPDRDENENNSRNHVSGRYTATVSLDQLMLWKRSNRRGLPQRRCARAVVELLGRQNCCMSAQEIFDSLRRARRPVGIASVYRALETLADLRLVKRIDAGDGIARLRAVAPDGDHITITSSAGTAARSRHSATCAWSARSTRSPAGSATRSRSTRSCSPAPAPTALPSGSARKLPRLRRDRARSFNWYGVRLQETPLRRDSS